MKDKIFRYRGELLSALLGILFITIAATWESPLYKGSYGFDASFFSMMGRAILEGRVPYKDYFDIKGPAFFFVQAFGQLIHRDRLGVYIIECVAASSAFVFLFKICKLYNFSIKKTVAVFFVTVYVYVTTLWGGNTVEEFMLPLNYAALFYGLLFLKGKSKDLGVAFFYGIVTSFAVFSKVTTAAPAYAVVICVIIYLISHKRYKDLFICIGLFVAGFISVAAPIFLYFYLRNALPDFINAAFVVAFKRSTDYYEPVSLKWESYLIICYVGILMFIARIKYRGYEKALLLAMSVITFIALHFGTPFDYYFTTALPLFSFISILICRDAKLLYFIKGKKFKYVLNNMIIAIIGLVVALMFYNSKTLNKLYECYRIASTQSEMEAYENYKDIFSLIPEYEYKDVFCIESGMILYEVNQVLPENKYPVNYPYFTELYPQSKKEVLYRLNKYPPKWIVSEDMEHFQIDEIREYVLDHYMKVTDNPVDELWLKIY